jgi:hypothetical protein
VLLDLQELVADDQVVRLRIEEKSRVVLEIGNHPPQRIMLSPELIAGSVHQVHLDLGIDSVVAHLNGVRCAAEQIRVPLRLSDRHIQVRGGSWSGALIGLRLWDGRVSQADVSEDLRSTTMMINQRAKLTRRTIRAVPVARSSIPTPTSILPYRSALAVDTYQIVQGDGELASGARCRVAHWVIMDGQTITPFSGTKSGEAVELTLESLADHPELESIFLVDTGDHSAGEEIWVEADR